MGAEPSGPYAEWLATRPECVQKLAAEFPLGMPIVVDGVEHWVIGYNESDMLLISPLNPADDFEGSKAAKAYLCAAHLRGQ